MNDTRGTTLAFVLLLAASVQAALLVPYVILVPGERTNLFSPLLMLLPALALLPGVRRDWLRGSFLAWAILGAGLAVTAVLSPEPAPGLMRAFAFFAPAASGLFCAWRLLSDDGRARCFLHLLTFCYCALGAGYWLFGQTAHYQGLHHHALTGAMVLLAAGPFSLLLSRSRGRQLAGAVLLALGMALCLAAGSRYLAVLPFVLIPAGWAAGRLRPAAALGGIAAAAAIAAFFFYANPEKIPRVNNYESTFYRLEGIPASLQIIRQHPLAGIGIRTSRGALLAEYEPLFGMTDKATLLSVVEKNVTSDNQYLSLPVGIGLPLSFLYFFLLWQLFRRYHAGTLKGSTGSIAMRAPAIPLAATMVHFFLYDGLFYPQINWFFHLLLGLGAFAAPAGQDTLNGRTGDSARPEK